jgi:hypothetical protein
MTKQDFIAFLKVKAEEAGLHGTRWKRRFLNNEDYWTLVHPTLDWMEDQMDLTEDGEVKITYFESIYDDPKSITMSYIDFVADHSKSVSLF